MGRFSRSGPIWACDSEPRPCSGGCRVGARKRERDCAAWLRLSDHLEVCGTPLWSRAEQRAQFCQICARGGARPRRTARAHAYHTVAMACALSHCSALCHVSAFCHTYALCHLFSALATGHALYGWNDERDALTTPATQAKRGADKPTMTMLLVPASHSRHPAQGLQDVRNILGGKGWPGALKLGAVRAYRFPPRRCGWSMVHVC